MSSKSIRNLTINGLKWSGIEQFSTQIISFALGIILARLLSPSDYGVVGILAVFIAVSQTFIDSGFTQALIRKADLNTKDCCTVFYFNIIISFICYVILFLCSGLIADFFHMPILSPVIKVYCTTLVIGALETVQISRLTINLDFKRLAKVNIISSIVSGVVGIILAYYGFGVWALVLQSVFSRIFHVIAIWKVVNWIPGFIFSRDSFKELFSFGSKLLAGGLIWQLYSNFIPILIARFYSASDLGYYNRGTSLAQLPSTTIISMLEKVTFPILAKIKDDTSHLVEIYRKYIKSSSMAIMFCLVLLAALAKPLILTLLTAKWLQSVIFLQIFIFAEMFDHIQKLNINLLKVTGRSDLVLKLEIYKRGISVLIILASTYWGVIGICTSRVVIAQVSLLFNTYYTGKIFGLGYLTQVKDFMPYAIYSIISCTPAYLLSYTLLPNWAIIMIGIVISPAIYLFILSITQDKSYAEFVRPIFNRFSFKLSN